MFSTDGLLLLVDVAVVSSNFFNAAVEDRLFDFIASLNVSIEFLILFGCAAKASSIQVDDLLGRIEMIQVQRRRT